MMAFALSRFPNEGIKNDPKFVKWFAEYVTFSNGTYEYTEIPMYPCTEDDYARFYEVNKASSALAKQLKDERAFMCLNWRDVELAGADPAPETKALDVMVLPCNMKETLLADDLKEDRIPEDCNWDK